MEKEQAAQFYRNRQSQKEREELIKACRNGLKIAQSQNFGKRKRQDFSYDHFLENLEYYKNLFDIELSDYQTIMDLFNWLSGYYPDLKAQAIEMEFGKVWAKLLDPNIMAKFNNDISQQALHDLQAKAIYNIWSLVMHQEDYETIVPTIIEASSVGHIFQFFDEDIGCSLYLKIENSHPELVDRRKIVSQATELIERGKNENSVNVYFDGMFISQYP